jgi:hypothetical protein
VAASFSLTGTLRLDPRWVDDLNTTLVTDATRVNLTLSLTNGDGDGEADAYWRDVRTVAAAPASDLFDITALPLSVFGGTGTLNIATLRAIYIRNLSETQELSYSIQGIFVPLPPLGVFFAMLPEGSGASQWLADTTDIEIQNSTATAADYEIILIGVKA